MDTLLIYQTKPVKERAYLNQLYLDYFKKTTGFGILRTQLELSIPPAHWYRVYNSRGSLGFTKLIKMDTLVDELKKTHKELKYNFREFLLHMKI